MVVFRPRGGVWPPVLVAGLVLGALALCWRVRDAPLMYGGLVRADALGAWFGAITLAGLLVAVSAERARPGWWVLAAVPLLISYALAPMLGIAAGYLVCTALLAAPRRPLARRALAAAPAFLPALCLLIGYGALALRGAASYDARSAGAALDSLAFWFVLLAALAPIVGLARAKASFGPRGLLARCLAPAWLYPLARLYSLGPWNTGWALATLLLGGALAGWCAFAALFRHDAAGRAAALTAGALAGTLAALGLGTSAGVAAACYGLLSYILLVAGGWVGQAGAPAVTGQAARWPWLFSSAFPFAAPFAASWMLIGASMAGGVPLLAGGLWLAALLAGLAWAVWGLPADGAGLHRAVALASATLGVGAPLVVQAWIEPVAAQLQAGLGPYGEIHIWPWIGLATNDAAHIPVATWPSLALALLMLVLCALVYTLARLRASAPAELPAVSCSPDRAVLRALYHEVPWLALVLGWAAPPLDEHDNDAE